MSRALKSVLAASAIVSMSAFLIAHAPAARAQDQTVPPPAGSPLAATPATAAPGAADDLPAGPDHDLVKTTCTMCHMSTQFSGEHKTSAEWNDILTEMQGLGAVIPPENAPKIVAYLATNFGPAGGSAAAPATPGVPAAAPPTDAGTPAPATPATPAPADSALPAAPATPPPADAATPAPADSALPAPAAPAAPPPAQ